MGLLPVVKVFSMVVEVGLLVAVLVMVTLRVYFVCHLRAPSLIKRFALSELS